MRKSGMTMLMLVIYITVLLILAGISVSTIIDSKEAEEVTEKSYKSIIRQYIKEFETTKSYYEVKNKIIPNGIIEGSDLLEYIPSISLEHMEYILIEDGKLKYNIVVTSEYAEKEYLEDLVEEGILDEYTP